MSVDFNTGSYKNVLLSVPLQQKFHQRFEGDGTAKSASWLRAGNPVFPIQPVQFFQQPQSAFRVAARGGGEERRLGLILRDDHVRPRIHHLIDALAAAAGDLPDAFQLVISAPTDQ